MSKHVPDGKTLVQLAITRWRARTREIQRRSVNHQSEDLEQELLRETLQELAQSVFQRAEREIAAAYPRIMDALIDTQAVRNVIARVAEWGAEGESDAEVQACKAHWVAEYNKKRTLIRSRSWEPGLKSEAWDFMLRGGQALESVEPRFIAVLGEDATPAARDAAEQDAMRCHNNAHAWIIWSGKQLKAALVLLEKAKLKWREASNQDLAEVDERVAAALEQERLRLRSDTRYIEELDQWLAGRIRSAV